MSDFYYQKILIIRLSSLGDVLLTTPLIRSLKNDNPKTEIQFLVREEYKDAIICNPHISKLIVLDRAEITAEIKYELSRSNYDLIIDLQNNFRSTKLLAGLKCPKVKFKKLSWKKFLLVKFKINKLKDAKSIPERYADTLNNFNLDDNGLDLFTKNQHSSGLTGLNKLIGFCPGSRHYTKMWTKENYIELGKKIIENGGTVALFGGKNDKQICDEISFNVSGVINLCNENNILQTAADMKMCKTIVCNDSGLMHAACAVNVPVIAIFGSTVKEFGFFPYRCKNLVLENKSLTCRPCSHIGRQSCPKKHFKCMNEITPDSVYNSLIHFLAEI